jgi:chemotaxis signal transduction protein
MASTEALRARLTDLRESFDRAFSEPHADGVEVTLDLLRIRVGGDPYAVRLSQLAALEADRTITQLPSDHAELLGIAGMRGGVVAVFDLAELIGVQRAEATRWLILAKGAPIAFAFSAFDGQLGVRPDAIASADQSLGQTGQVVQIDGRALPLIDIAGLVAALERRPRAHRGDHAV